LPGVKVTVDLFSMRCRKHCL